MKIGEGMVIRNRSFAYLFYNTFLVTNGAGYVILCVNVIICLKEKCNV